LERLALVFPSHSIHLFSLEALRLRVIEQEGITHEFDLILLCSLIFIRFLSLTLERLGRELGISVNLACRRLQAETSEEKLTLSWNSDSTLSAIFSEVTMAYSLDDSLLI
jgi:hypothetical protein